MRQMGALLLLGVIVAGCAGSKSGDVYSRDEARRVQTVRLGTVESVRTVRIEGTKSNIGTTAGTVVGAIAGSSVGQGKGSAAASVLGAVGGGVVGAAAEEGLTRQDALEITIRLESGQFISIVQAGEEKFQPGDKVRILEIGGESRVSRN